MLRRLSMVAIAAAVGLGLTGFIAHADPDKDKVKEFRVGLLGGENTQDRLARYGKFQQLLEQKLGIPVKLFPAADYAGVMQGIAAGQLGDGEASAHPALPAPGWAANAWNPSSCRRRVTARPTTTRSWSFGPIGDQVGRRDEGSFAGVG